MRPCPDPRRPVRGRPCGVPALRAAVLAASAVLAALLAAPGPGSSALAAEALRGDALAFPQAIPEVGEALEIVGRIDAAGSQVPFPLLPGEREYTWTLYGAVVYAEEAPGPGIRTLHLTFGILEIREDPAFNSAYAPHPPNAVVPSAFHDGQTLLLGVVTGLRIREIFGITTATGDVRFEAGTALPALAGATGWTLAAAVSPYDDSLPPGYGARWNVELSAALPVGVEDASWAGIKALYR